MRSETESPRKSFDAGRGSMKAGGFTWESICLAAAAAVSSGIIGGCVNAQPEELNPDLLNLRLTEIHYNPLPLDDYSCDSLEFVEVKNTGSAALDLGELEFIDGIAYRFPGGARLQSDDFFVIASSVNAFKQRYGYDPDGVFEGHLRNGGERIEVFDNASFETIISQSYADTGAWPKDADGDGYSLVPVNINPGRDETGPEFWRSSTRLHGSPGKDDEPKVFDSTLYDLRITEIHYHPLYVADTIGEDSLEFIELKNTGSITIELTNVEFTAGIDYKFAAATKLQPGAFIVLASNAKWFKERYQVDPFDVYDGQLRNSGETLAVEEVRMAVTLLSIAYSDGNPWPSRPDGDGWSLVTINVNPGRNEQNNPASWRQSFRIDGSPGEDDPGVVFVNEVLPHTDAPQVDAVELCNPGNAAVDIGGWFITDRRVDPAKFRIPDNTVVPAGGYVVFTADDFNADPTSPTSFAFSEFGDDAYIMSDATGCRGYCHGCSFGALDNGISYGRYIIPSTGNEVFVPMKDVTLGDPNTGPLVGPLVISEIMYRSQDGNSDYIEVTNISNREVTLYDPQYPDNTWRIDGITFSFPKAAAIRSGKSVVVVSDRISVDAFRSNYTIAADVQVFPFSGSLSDSGEVLELEKPTEPEKDSTGAVISTTVNYMEYEKVSYKNRSPWPAGALGTGSSLTRISNKSFGNDPGNWAVADPTPGKVEY
ncbi:MAG: lamin tail domain-containing protein [Chitinispirillaceae bacterium]|nr:lamin tail domain-containing protein [Chitinispirillaceae bacterium]